jgi:hypothetical protein
MTGLIVAMTCVAATTATLISAVVRRIRLHRSGLNGVLARQGNYTVMVETARFVKQGALSYGVWLGFANPRVHDDPLGAERTALMLFVCVVMALTSLMSLGHWVRMSRAMHR